VISVGRCAYEWTISPSPSSSFCTASDAAAADVRTRAFTSCSTARDDCRTVKNASSPSGASVSRTKNTLNRRAVLWAVFSAA
jgi:hypothetical protein